MPKLWNIPTTAQIIMYLREYAQMRTKLLDYVCIHTHMHICVSPSGIAYYDMEGAH